MTEAEFGESFEVFVSGEKYEKLSENQLPKACPRDALLRGSSIDHRTFFCVPLPLRKAKRKCYRMPKLC
jgi:hypothetical protein